MSRQVLSRPQTSACRSCGRQVLWAVSSKTERLMPLDVEPNPLGNVYVELSRDGEVPPYPTATVDAALAAAAPAKARYISHFATCPSADRHRSRPARPAKRA